MPSKSYCHRATLAVGAFLAVGRELGFNLEPVERSNGEARKHCEATRRLHHFTQVSPFRQAHGPEALEGRVATSTTPTAYYLTCACAGTDAS